MPVQHIGRDDDKRSRPHRLAIQIVGTKCHAADGGDRRIEAYSLFDDGTGFDKTLNDSAGWPDRASANDDGVVPNPLCGAPFLGSLVIPEALLYLAYAGNCFEHVFIDALSRPVNAISSCLLNLS